MLRVFVVVSFMCAVASAGGGGIVLESYTGDRPADAPRLLGPVLDELSRQGYAAGDSVARTFETRGSRPALAGSGLPSDFSAQVDRGFKAWVQGKFDDAINVLGPLIKTAQANSGAFAVNPALRDPLLKALIALALAHQRSGDLQSMKATFAEILRSFPDAQISRATYGPDAQSAFDQTRRALQSGGRGKLTIKLIDETGVVFVNESYRATGSTTIELMPGEYRVIVVLNKSPSRNHVVEVKTNGETLVEVDPKMDRAVHTNGYTGLAFATQSNRDATEAIYAARWAKLAGATSVIVVGIDDVRGRTAVVGSLVSLQTGRELRRASVPTEPDPSTDKLRALARFLAGENPVPGLDVQFSNALEAIGGGEGGDTSRGGGGNETPHRQGRWGGWRWITGGFAFAALATGGVLVALDGRCPSPPPMGQQCNDFYDTGTAGYITLGGGAVLAAISIYLFVTHDKAPYVAPTQGGATVGFATRF